MNSIDEIYLKKYSDIQKRKFLQIINLDPTTIKNVKIGRYCNWLLKNYRQEFKDQNNPRYKHVEFHLLNLNKKSVQNIKFVMLAYKWGRRNGIINKLSSFKSMSTFLYNIDIVIRHYKTELRYGDKLGKIYTIYEDENVKVLHPLDFAGIYRYSKHSEWCSKFYNGYKMWVYDNLMLRFVDKKTNTILRLTWSYKDSQRWSWASPVYPEFGDYFFKNKNEPFEFEKFNLEILEKNENDQKRYIQLKDLFEKLSQNVIEKITQRYKYCQQRWQNKEKKKEKVKQKSMTSYINYENVISTTFLYQ